MSCVVTVMRLSMVYSLIVSMPVLYCPQGGTALHEVSTVVALHIVTAAVPGHQVDIAVAVTGLLLKIH